MALNFYHKEFYRYGYQQAIESCHHMIRNVFANNQVHIFHNPNNLIYLIDYELN